MARNNSNLLDEDEEDLKEESKRTKFSIDNLSNVKLIIILIIFTILFSIISVFITYKYIKYNNSVNINILNSYIESLELKTAYGYKHPIQKIDINISEYAKTYLLNKNQLSCGNSSQLDLKKEEDKLEFISCNFINEIENNKLAKNITIYVPDSNNKEIFSEGFNKDINKYSNYSFFIEFNKGDVSLLDSGWILIDRQGRQRDYSFCQKYINLCKFTLNYNSSDFKWLK